MRTAVEKPTFELEKLDFDEDMKIPLYSKLYYALENLYFVQHPQRTKRFKVFSRNVEQFMQYLNSIKLYKPSELAKTFPHYAGKAAYRTYINKLSGYEIGKNNVISCLLQLGIIIIQG